MKNDFQIYALILPFLVFSLAHSATFKIQDPCQNKIAFQTQVAVGFPYPSLGKLTVDQLTTNKIPFTGSAAGISSIYKTPTGDDSLVVVSDTEMYAYGWCYHYNGTEPGEMADQILIKNNSDVVEWFFAYSTYKNGEWLTMCAPAYNRPLKNYCR